MNAGRDNLDSILTELEHLRLHEAEVLSRISALLDSPSHGLPASITGVFSLAKEVFETDAVKFLVTPHRELHGEMPIRVAQDTEGAKRVEELLQRIIHGIPA